MVEINTCDCTDLTVIECRSTKDPGVAANIRSNPGTAFLILPFSKTRDGSTVTFSPLSPNSSLVSAELRRPWLMREAAGSEEQTETEAAKRRKTMRTEILRKLRLKWDNNYKSLTF
ncbi:hypothetical protein F8388_020471 [Cannabis sativa]|uniref:Uncharacterized protein n=1 Tax=Cannabis sativa TaxID=3483 RepID=A0A7J6EX67_CANSA|nr:hypothetical protein F8388_025913 [Cannabis sativa]KAF4362955.1 hypothetical protein F8388_020471 [Cannabis sativa]